MNTLMKAGKYAHILYYVLAFIVYVDLMLIMIAPESQMGLVGTGCALAIIPGILSTFILIKKKSFLRKINYAIPIGIILIILFGPNM